MSRVTEDKPFLPYGRHLIEDDDIDAVVEVLKSDYLTTGPAVAAFEKRLAETTGAEHAIAVNSGTAALHLAAMALGLDEGDRIVVPAITFLATANAARYVGAEVTFSDVDPDTGLMTAETLADALDRGGDEIKAVFPVHLNGQVADMDSLTEVEGTRDLAFVEDACHALGGFQRLHNGNEAPVGSCAKSDMATFSFHPVKTVAMGEGGAVTTNNSNLAAQIERLRNHGMTRIPREFNDDSQAFDVRGEPNPWYYEMHDPGFNYRSSALHCALGSSQLAKLSRFVAHRRRMVDWYHKSLSGLDVPVKPLPVVDHGVPAWHLAVVLIDFERSGKSRAQVMEGLRAIGIGSQVHYLPVNRQPYYRDRYGEISLPGADRYYERALSLPLFQDMTESDVERVVNGLKQVLGG